MTGGSISDARRRQARKSAEKVTATCPCGREIYGNGVSHQRSCRQWLAELGWPLDAGLRDAIIQEGGNRAGTERLLGVEQMRRLDVGESGLGELRWVEYRDLVWSKVAEAGAR